MILSPVLACGLLAIGLAPSAVAAQHYPVTGVKVDDGAEIPLRLNVNDLYNQGGPQWDLYLRALRSLQDKDASDPLSYFQVSGIHGLPYMEWQNGGPYRATGWAGYCPHGETIFLPWHRPFVLVFEQVLVAEAQKIAETYPDAYRSQYRDAAVKLRSPFWDWSRESNVPPCTIPSQLPVNVPDGEGLRRIMINNPLQTYTYPQKARNGQFGEFVNFYTTSRCPPPNRYPDSANARLNSLGLKQSTYDIFTFSRSFRDFASTREDGSIGIEQIHNSIHWDAGCGGQFLDSNTAAFDGLFMLHHTHVDRLWAYGSYINPDVSVFDYRYYGQSRYSTPQDTIMSPDSPLEPFYDGQDSYWTSRKVASIRGMGYTYEGLEYWRKSPEELRQDASRIINDLYAPSGDDGGMWKRSKRDRDHTRFFAKIELDRTQVQRPCTITIFVDGKAAGKVVAMQQPEHGVLHGRVAVDREVHGVFATSPSSNGTVSSIEHLVEMDIRKPDGTVIPLNSVPSLKLTLEEVKVTPPKSQVELASAGEKTKLPVNVRERHRDNKDKP
ncbi:hypothetical protein E4U53_001424 [Claviceps sorghi]|nr:hypothetical protein E4U53_001424 [Claviceps sorghi]